MTVRQLHNYHWLSQHWQVPPSMHSGADAGSDADDAVAGREARRIAAEWKWRDDARHADAARQPCPCARRGGNLVAMQRLAPPVWVHAPSHRRGPDRCVQECRARAERVMVQVCQQWLDAEKRAQPRDDDSDDDNGASGAHGAAPPAAPPAAVAAHPPPAAPAAAPPLSSSSTRCCCPASVLLHAVERWKCLSMDYDIQLPDVLPSRKSQTPPR